MENCDEPPHTLGVREAATAVTLLAQEKSEHAVLKVAHADLWAETRELQTALWGRREGDETLESLRAVITELQSVIWEGDDQDKAELSKLLAAAKYRADELHGLVTKLSLDFETLSVGLHAQVHYGQANEQAQVRPQKLHDELDEA